MQMPTIRPALSEVQAIASEGAYEAVTLSCELLADTRTPVELLCILQNVSAHCFLLESATTSEQWGRYTFLGFDPTLLITCKDGVMNLGAAEIETADPAKHLRRVIGQYASPRFSYLPPFSGGLVGYFSYDYLKYAEPTLKLDAHDSEGFQDIDLMLFDKVIAFDHIRQKITLMRTFKLSEGDAGYNRAARDLADMCDLVLHGQPAPAQPGRITGDVTPLFDKSAYCAMIERAKGHIREGDIFQIVLSNRLQAPFEGSLLDTYRMLRTINPSPYLFYFGGSDVEVAGSSPETLVKLEDGVLRTFPLAGTRPRGKTPEEDERLERELLQDEKELAEHNMLVDLGRNDIGRISEFGSVEVEQYCKIERYSHVMHIGSTVKGTLREGLDALDALGSILPAGTLSGAPKIRACQLINDLEGNKRGIYGGAVGYLDFAGNLDTCIAIRIAYKKNGKVFVRSGAGIVADSIPENEYRECINKAQAVVDALRAAEEVAR